MSTAEVVETETVWASNSTLTLHRSCPQAWNYGRVRKLERIPDQDDFPVERDFGSWWHALRAVHSIVRGRVFGSLRALPEVITTVDEDGPTFDPETVTLAEIGAAARQWWSTRSVGYEEAFLSRMGGPLPERLQYVHNRWKERWADEIPTEQPIAVELRWNRVLPALPGPDGSVTDPNLSLVGYVDEVYLDTRRNIVVARDHKTSKALGTQTTADDMMDSQLQLYAWGASPMVNEWDLGPIRATAYDRVRSVSPHPPGLTKSGRLTMRDGKPTLGQCDLHTYRAWSAGEDGQGVPFEGLKKDGSAAGFYTADPAIEEFLGTPVSQSIWFQRTLTPLNLNLVRAHLRAAVDSGAGMALTRARVAVTGEAPRNLTPGCRWCDFVKLCRAEMVGGPDGDFVLADFGLRKRSEG